MTLFLRSFFVTSTFWKVEVVVAVDVVVEVLRDADIATLLSAEELSIFDSFRVTSAAAAADADADVVTVIDSFLNAVDDTSAVVDTTSAGATWMFRVRFALISPLELLTTHL